MGGAYISAPGTFAFGAEIAIIFDLPGVRSARLPAVVRWSKPGGFGVQFGLLGARETHALSTLIQAAKR
jgi:type IV pilus assembly protein PilZ